ncbi:Flagellar biosynthesis protein fliC [Aequoribacter fuscus]|jgi:flagellin|uniref:Flagellin n=1 Tax=Aequoribacter fuscus TaxID=2518989 RepID=F3L2C1_9GAMM|nr:flagellin [Aequoribacter fuscus]EGG29494.1 Flagellar biosynthesis protein fliC [Aequoribacter fuscus]QHJ89060.1 flagellin [Aequoribacter fuscus]
MSVINTNVSATLTQNAISKNERAMSSAMEQLSTGKRINSASDDAAGLAIASRMTSQINGLAQAARNANDAISLVQTADGALTEVTSMLQRMRELAVQSASDTNVSADRTALNQEFTELRSEINRIAANTQWNGTNILDGTVGSSGELSFQIGANASQTISVTLDDFQTTSDSQSTTLTANTSTAASGPSATGAAQVSTVVIGGTVTEGDVLTLAAGGASVSYTVTAADVATGSSTAADTVATALSTALGTVSGITKAVSGATITFTASSTSYGSNSFDLQVGDGGLMSGISSSEITSQSLANTAVAALDTAIGLINTERSEMGATINRLQFAADNLLNVKSNAEASRSRIEDTDYASVTTELARTQIIQQAATAMLAQANQIPQTVLALLK